jgi:mono/diheme cytochrome c family protein
MRKSKGFALLVFLFPVLVTLVFLFVLFVEPMSSSAQNSNSSTTTNRNSSRELGAPKTASPPAPPQDFSKNTWELPEDAAKTKNPIQATPESVAKGKELYHGRAKGNCIFCHGESGSGNEGNRAMLRRKPADLSNKERMSSMTDGEIFWKISKGITGIMPAGEQRMDEEERWHVVNYARTLAKDPVK